MIGKMLSNASKIFIGGKYHWKTILTGFGLYSLLKPKARPNLAAQQQLDRHRQGAQSR